MGAPKKVRWEKLEKEYVTGDCTYKDLADKYNVSHKEVRVHGASEGWRNKRKEFRAKALQKSLTKSVNNEAERLAKIGIAANHALDVAMKAFEDEHQFNRYIVSTSVGPGMTDMEERIYEKLDTRALKDLTATIKDLTSIIRNVYGIPTQAEAEAQRVAAEKLELDKKRADADTDRDVTITVSLPDEMKEYAK